MAVDVHEAELAQPCQLRLDVEQLVRRVIVFGRHVQGSQEGLMQGAGRRRNVLEIAEHPSGLQQFKYFSVQRSFPFMPDVMNGKTGNDGIEAAERRWQR